MSEQKTTEGLNDRPRNETIAGTGPGIPDDALAPGEVLPTAPTDEEVARVARKLGAPEAPGKEQD
ncbi:hypothetical protein LK533_09240 [Sphingomonas sp. PL-96]|uniref:hypothetical protein n=1 Tax=Sphingomonas sp. PL-96 TaxID=2887201 RepID=UPI001E3A441C|nr:hypothetical protein [Sphingomonas sp. PL-96]MCC2976855.1 hypothetical protein [Sphingomonas sp. PL-96]